MEATFIDFSQQQRLSGHGVIGLKSYLTQLIGEPFRFTRVSDGDELTLHFGELRPARAPKLKGKPYGAFVLGLRASPWILKSGAEAIVITAGQVFDPPSPDVGTRLRKEELESGRFIAPEARVLTATPFVVKQTDGFGLELRMSDASTMLVLPTIPEHDAPEDVGLPTLADWELSSPHGLLRAGPGLQWSFKPSEHRPPGRQGNPEHEQTTPISYL